MTTILLISIILLFLFIIIGITFRKDIISCIQVAQDNKLRKWCVKQAARNSPMDQYSAISETYSSSSDAVAASAEAIYLFIKEHTTYLSEEEKKNIFPERYKEDP